MNSPFANLFIAIQSHIRASLAAITHIDQDLGQLKNARPPVTWPCLLLDFEDFTFSDLSENVQTARGTVVLRLGFAALSNTTQATPDTYVQKALGYYDLEWALHKTLQGWSPGAEFGSLNRESVSTQKRTDNYRVRELRYTIAFEDYSTKRTLQFTPAEMIVATEIDV